MEAEGQITEEESPTQPARRMRERERKRERKREKEQESKREMKRKEEELNIITHTQQARMEDFSLSQCLKIVLK